MNKSKKRKNLLIIIVLLAIVAIAVGYATMAQTLILNGTASTLSLEDWDVHFVTDPTPTMAPTTAEEHDGVFEQSISLQNLTGEFSVVLAPGASIEYEIKVVNDGRLHAILNGDPKVEGETEHIKCTVTPVEEPIELYTEGGNVSGTDKFKVKIDCLDMNELPNKAEEAKIKVTFDYTQAH